MKRNQGTMITIGAVLVALFASAWLLGLFDRPKPFTYEHCETNFQCGANCYAEKQGVNTVVVSVPGEAHLVTVAMGPFDDEYPGLQPGSNGQIVITGVAATSLPLGESVTVECSCGGTNEIPVRSE